MAIAYVSKGLQSSGSTLVTPSYPASIANGDMLVLTVANKYPTFGPVTPSGWFLAGQATGGAGGAGVDSGNVYATAYFRVADGTETGTLDVACPGGNSLTSIMYRYTKLARETWVVSAPSTGRFNLATAAWSVTGNTVIDIVAGDRIVAVSGVNADTYTMSLEGMTIPGVVMGNELERAEGGALSGDDVYLVTSDHAVTSGTAGGAPVYTMTSSGSSAGVSPAGATVMFRLRAAVVPSLLSRLRLGMGIGV